MQVRWGIVGVGRAGRARAAAIAADPDAQLVCGYRGQPEAAGLVAALSLEALLARVDAVAVCAPDDTHPALVAQALRAGRHVVCEFPLAPTAAEAGALLALARAQDRVLHVEHIELLSAAAVWWRAHPPVRPVQGHLRFTRAAPFPDPALGSLARLHRLVDILGLPEAVEAVRSADEGGLAATLRFEDGSVVGLEVCTGPGLPRETQLHLQGADGRRVVQTDSAVWVDGVPQALPAVGGLFAADHRVAMQRILHGAPSYVSEARLLAVLSLVETLRAAATRPAGGEGSRW